MVATKLNWRQAKDYEFTKTLDSAGWCWEFLRRNLNYRSDYAAMLEGFSDTHKAAPFLRRSKDVVERGPDILTMEEALGEKWGLNRAVNPDGDGIPEFRPQFPKELDWASVQGFYEAESDEAPVSIVAPYSILAFDLASDIDAQIAVAKEFLSRRSHECGDEAVSLRRQSQWVTYLRLLDAGPDVSTNEIVKHFEVYKSLSNTVYDNYKRTDRVSDHKTAAQSLCDQPLLILGLQVKNLPIIEET